MYPVDILEPSSYAVKRSGTLVINSHKASAFKGRLFSTCIIDIREVSGYFTVLKI